MNRYIVIDPLTTVIAIQENKDKYSIFYHCPTCSYLVLLVPLVRTSPLLLQSYLFSNSQSMRRSSKILDMVPSTLGDNKSVFLWQTNTTQIMIKGLWGKIVPDAQFEVLHSTTKTLTTRPTTHQIEFNSCFGIDKGVPSLFNTSHYVGI